MRQRIRQFSPQLHAKTGIRVVHAALVAKSTDTIPTEQTPTGRSSHIHPQMGHRHATQPVVPHSQLVWHRRNDQRVLGPVNNALS
jgi:hypothetical protein